MRSKYRKNHRYLSQPAFRVGPVGMTSVRSLGAAILHRAFKDLRNTSPRPIDKYEQRRSVHLLTSMSRDNLRYLCDVCDMAGFDVEYVINNANRIIKEELSS